MSVLVKPCAYCGIKGFWKYDEQDRVICYDCFIDFKVGERSEA